MLFGYICGEHGFVNVSDMKECWERDCPECGADVTPVSGKARSISCSPPVDRSHASGAITWDVRGQALRRFVRATDHREAIETVVEQIDDPQRVTEAKPKNVAYRRL